METSNLLSELRKNGFSVKAENSRLQIAPARDLTDELKKTIKQSKIEILCALHYEEELRRLVNLVADHNQFSKADRDEAIHYAMLDQINALTCYASLARRAKLY